MENLSQDPNKDEQLIKRKDDAGYTPDENQFADGKGTQLDKELAPDRGDIEDELSEEDEESFEDESLDDDYEEFKEQDS